VQFVISSQKHISNSTILDENSAPAKNSGEGSDVIGLRLLILWPLGVDDVNRRCSGSTGGVLIERCGGGIRHGYAN